MERLPEAAEYYSNVHRGSGQNSQVTTNTFEKCREDVLEYFGLSSEKFTVIFCSPAAANGLTGLLKGGSFKTVTSHEMGLPLGVVAIAAEKKGLPGGVPAISGGGTARLVSPKWVIWEKVPDRFEPGTPAVMNILALVTFLKMSRKSETEPNRKDDMDSHSAETILNLNEFEGMTAAEILKATEESIFGRTRTENALSQRFINLDYAASTPPFLQSFEIFLKGITANSVESQKTVELTRNIVSDFFGAPADKYDVIFTSNTTEAINIAAENESCSRTSGAEKIIINTILEHNSNELPWRNSEGLSVIRLSKVNNGYIDTTELEKHLAQNSQKDSSGSSKEILVALTGASNVLCMYNDLNQIGTLTRKYGARLLVDAAQMAAHRKIDMESAGIDYLAFSGHKTYAPFGSGALIVRKGLIKLSNEKIAMYKSSGEENGAGIAALGKALSILRSIGFDLITEKEHKLTSRCISGLSSIKGVTPYGIADTKDPLFEHKGPVVAFEVKDKWPQKISNVLAERGIGVRYGCHCAHMLVKKLVGVPPFLEQFQGFLLRLLPKLSLPGIMRISFGIGTKESDIDLFICEIEKISMEKQ